MGMNDTLLAQQSLNPFAQALQQQINQSAMNAQAQEEMALRQVATAPNMIAQAESPAMALPKSYANVKNRSPFSNLGFSGLNAYVAAAPQMNFQESSTVGGGVAQGVQNAFNILEQRNAQKAILDVMQQQQMAEAQQQMAEQMQAAQAAQAAQAKINAISQGLQAMGQPKAIADAMALSERYQAIENYGSQIGTTQGRIASDQPMAQALQQIGVPDTGVLTAPQQIRVNQLTGQTTDMFQNPRQEAEARKAAAGAEAATQGITPDVQAKVLANQGKLIQNQIDASTARYADAMAKVELLRESGKVDEANHKQELADKGMALLSSFQENPESMTPENIAMANAVFSAAGLGSITLPEQQYIKLKTGKNKEAVYQQMPSGLVQITDLSGNILQREPQMTGVIAAPQVSKPVIQQVPPKQQNGSIKAATPNLLQQEGELLQRFRQTKQGSAERQAIAKQIEAIRAKRVPSQNANRTIGGSVNFQPLNVGGLQFDPFGPTIPIMPRQGF